MKYPAYPCYKDSGVEWLGDVPEHWRMQKFKHLFTLSDEKNGESIVGEMLSVSGYRGIVVKEYEDENQKRTEDNLRDYRVVRSGQLVVNTMWLNYAGLGVSKYEGYVSPAYRAYFIKDKINGWYAHHLLRSSTYVSGYTKYLQGIRPNSLQIKAEDFSSLPVLLPPYDEQKIIADFLDHQTAKIDILIAKQEQLIELLQEKRKSIITHAVTKGLNPDVATKDSGIEWLEEIPVHWIAWKLGMIAKYFSGATPSKEDLRYWNGDVIWVTPKDMKRPYIDSSEDTISEDALNETGLTLHKPPVLLIVVRGMILAHTLPVAITTAPVTINQDMKALKLVEGIDYDFSLYLLQGLSNAILSLLVGESAHGTKVMRMDKWKKFLFYIPDISEQQEIRDWLNVQTAKFDVLINKAQQQIELLREHRASLISAAVTGKIDVQQYVD